ncbi:hypothetical protein NY2A_b749L [Paramecium bursaria Chlorella virus NY2A]|uniref:Uncharacterized protein b749L n=1 Tax=Paramecium bursaria Chlorella virus NY2A TaxID=46021 RepID=A7IXS4_PBCVN|nr:hypothetical protein NY2A_b749L [Paramecium bursaria Chlorella virus NY2A]ABT15148.1 hypothetical protein NY2A_b749L [Paramecium bursaria Chlorella virus NY2A]
MGNTRHLIVHSSRMKDMLLYNPQSSNVMVLIDFQNVLVATLTWYRPHNRSVKHLLVVFICIVSELMQTNKIPKAL